MENNDIILPEIGIFYFYKNKWNCGKGPRKRQLVRLLSKINGKVRDIPYIIF